MSSRFFVKISNMDPWLIARVISNVMYPSAPQRACSTFSHTHFPLTHARAWRDAHTTFHEIGADQDPTLGPWLEEICLSSHFVVSLASSIFLVSSKYLLTNC